MDDRVYVGIFVMGYYRTKKIGKNKSNSNKFKCRHEYFDTHNDEGFTIKKKELVFDTMWAYLLQYENGVQRVVTEPAFQFKVDKGVYQRVTNKTSKKVAEAGYFGDNELFRL